jgi:hypothetical protein
MRHKIPIQRVNLQWSYITKKLDLVDHYFSSYHGSVIIMNIELEKGKISMKCMEEISKLYQNVWGIRNENIHDFFQTYNKAIPNIKIFESTECGI